MKKLSLVARAPLINITPVILCGGSGTRLWPLSRTGFPKQFLCLMGDESLFQQAARRLVNLGEQIAMPTSRGCNDEILGGSPNGLAITPPLIVTGEEHRFLAYEQLLEVGIAMGAAMLEPVGRNTAPGLTLAALAAMENGGDPVLVVTPADQTVSDFAAFTVAIQTAVREAERGTIVILGVTPDAPETGYGYVEVDSLSRGPEGAEAIHKVLAFAEKPDLQTAQRYLLGGSHFWNAGIFILKASIWLKALETFRPDILQATQNAWQARTRDANTTAHFIRPGKKEFMAIPSESIDYAVMEKCPASTVAISMVHLKAGWSDLGAWDAVWKLRPKDAHGNVIIGDGLTTETRGSLLYSTSRLVALVGVQNLVVVETPDAVLVADRSLSQDVKHIVSAIQQHKREEHTLHRKVHRPWGWYDSIDEGRRFKVKRIQVKPGASLSMQKHRHRAEHWVVVSGTAEITCGDKKLLLTENQSTYIPLGEVHRLANPGSIPLEIIEVQSGSYLGEDDIVRVEDNYGRN
jgi:mannose-1-phosphate guanylyltransferase/mannose-6-phosphate isomerase